MAAWWRSTNRVITTDGALSLGTPAGKKKCAVSMTTPVIPHTATQILLDRLVTTAPFFCWPGRSPKWPLGLIQGAGFLHEGDMSHAPAGFCADGPATAHCSPSSGERCLQRQADRLPGPCTPGMN
jgi:hypothetical protein